MNRFYMKGKIIKNYKIGELIGKVSDMGLFQGVRDD